MQKKKYVKLLHETQAMNDKYNRQNRTRLAYMAAVGQKITRISEELRGMVEKEATRDTRAM